MMKLMLLPVCLIGICLSAPAPDYAAPTDFKQGPNFPYDYQGFPFNYRGLDGQPPRAQYNNYQQYGFPYTYQYPGYQYPSYQPAAYIRRQAPQQTYYQPQVKLTYLGKFTGTCEGSRDGLYFVDERSFAFCSNNIKTIQSCAEGSANPPYSDFENGKYQYIYDFCSINLAALAQGDSRNVMREDIGNVDRDIEKYFPEVDQPY